MLKSLMLKSRMPGWLGLALLALLLLVPAAGQAAKSRYDKVAASLPALRDFQVPQVTREQLPNGMVLYLVEDHDLPLVRLSAMIRAGRIYEPGVKTGLADLVGEVMRTGGTERYPGDQLDELLENMGASVETGMDEASASASLRCLTENFDEVLAIFVDVLRHPAFPEEKLDLAITQAKSGISRRNDDASGIADREIQKLYYGADSPYARQPEYDTLAAIERADLIAFHEYFYHPNNVILIAGGDFDTAAMKAKLSAAFADWPQTETFFPPDPLISDTPMSVNYIAKEDVNQSKVRMGHLGIRWDDEHLFPLSVLNEILGGGFGSRLFTEVRSKRELAYGVWAWMITGNHHRMPFTVGVDTKSESTVEAITIIMDELRKVREEPVTEDELERAKEGLKNSFVFNFSNPFSIASRKASYEFWGRPADFLDTYLAKVDAVTAADILAAAQARIHPDQMAILVVGRAEDFDAPLASLGVGEPTTIDISIPEPKFALELPEATSENLAAGRALMDKAVAAHGGAKALAAVKSLRIKGDFEIKETGMGPMTFGVVQQRLGEDRMRLETTTPFGNMVQVLTPEAGWVISPRGKQTITGDELATMWRSERSDALHLLRHLDEYRALPLGRETCAGEDCAVVYLQGEGDEGYKVFLAADHKIRGMEYKDNGQTGPVINLTIASDYAPASGVQFARNFTINYDGTQFATLTLKEVAVNPALEASLFGEPAE
jgi:zinc protease